MQLTERFRDAFDLAFRLHEVQQPPHRRKGIDVPYISHLMAVAGLVLEHDGDEDQAIAALLHDAVEDRGGPPVLEEIRRRFGEGVAAIVDDCTDAAPEGPARKPPWRPRKEAFLASLETMPARSRLVVAADKLHNARTLLTDWRRIGDVVYDRFTPSRSETLWYYRTLAARLQELGPTSLADELARIVTTLDA